MVVLAMFADAGATAVTVNLVQPVVEVVPVVPMLLDIKLAPLNHET
jgi:hypothetical protein